MAITYRPAVRNGEKLMIGVAGPSSAGKTFSALEIATGLQQVDGGDIFVIDTENRRAAMYADRFKFMHGEMRAPFTPEAYLEAIMAAVAAGAKIIVIDSMSHEHEGEGGILEMHEEVLNRMAGPDANFARREALKFSAWIEPKRRHNKMLNKLLQINAHIVFCFRAKDKLKMVKVQKGNRTVNEPVSAGWQPIAADRLEYEMTALLVLPPNARGKPDLGAEATKLPEPLMPMLQEGAQISRGLGVELARWARGDAAPRNASRESRDGGESRRPPSEDDNPPAREPVVGAALLRGYSAVLKGAKEKDDLAARHEGFEELRGADGPTVEKARDVYRLHLMRVANRITPDDCQAEVNALLEPEPA